MTRRRARHMRRVGEHVPCRTRRCMRHGTSNANGHGMPCDEGFPISAASKDTVGRIPPTCQHLMLRVSSEEGSSLFCTLLFQKNLDRSKLWSFSYLDFRYRNRPLRPFAPALVWGPMAAPADPGSKPYPNGRFQHPRWCLPIVG